MLLTFIAISFFFAMLIHEFGHLAAAKLCGVRVLELCFGLGPKVCGFRIGTVQYNLRLLPVASFVRLNSMELRRQPTSKRLLIHLGGVIINLIFALAGYGTVFGWANFLLAAVNLLPIYQHDGWKCGVVLLRALVRHESRPVEWTFTFSGVIVSLTLLHTVIRFFL